MTRTPVLRFAARATTRASDHRRQSRAQGRDHLDRPQATGPACAHGRRLRAADARTHADREDRQALATNLQRKRERRSPVRDWLDVFRVEHESDGAWLGHFMRWRGNGSARFRCNGADISRLIETALSVVENHDRMAAKTAMWRANCRIWGTQQAQSLAIAAGISLALAAVAIRG